MAKTIYIDDGLIQLKAISHISGSKAHLRYGRIVELSSADIACINRAVSTKGPVHIANGIKIEDWADSVAKAKKYRIVTVVGTNTLNGVSVTDKKVMFRSDGTWQTEWSGPQIFDNTFDLTFE